MKTSYFRPPTRRTRARRTWSPRGRLALEAARRSAAAKRAKIPHKKGKPGKKVTRKRA